MDRIEVNSSTVKSVGYSSEEQRLEVEFSSGGLYSYANVPQEVYDRFMASESKGHFFAVEIRACYPVTHLNPTKPATEETPSKEKKSKAKKTKKRIS